MPNAPLEVANPALDSGQPGRIHHCTLTGSTNVALSRGVCSPSKRLVRQCGHASTVFQKSAHIFETRHHVRSCVTLLSRDIKNTSPFQSLLKSARNVLESSGLFHLFQGFRDGRQYLAVFLMNKMITWDLFKRLGANLF